jgi:hypothetical protein
MFLLVVVSFWAFLSPLPVCHPLLLSPTYAVVFVDCTRILAGHCHLLESVNSCGTTRDMGTFLWSENNEDRLIELWRENPALYDTTLKSYHNRNTKDKILQEMCKELGCNGMYCIVNNMSCDIFNMVCSI